MLYSVVRLQPSGKAYDVPVEGDWVTIAVVAERGPVKLTMSSNIAVVEGGGEGSQEAQSRPLKGRKYITLKLVDFGVAGRSDKDGKKEIKGDALLTMLLFEADSCSKEKHPDDKSGKFAKKYYSGGSGGAYEACANLTAGTVIAIMNARILKPYKACSIRLCTPSLAFSHSAARPIC
jgi:minichromosome maintenance protein 10